MNKLIILVIASFILGGCTLQQYLPKQGKSANDTQPTPSPMLVSSPTTSPEPSLGTGTDESSIELDLDATVIEKEDFSDLE